MWLYHCTPMKRYTGAFLHKKKSKKSMPHLGVRYVWQHMSRRHGYGIDIPRHLGILLVSYIIKDPTEMNLLESRDYGEFHKCQWNNTFDIEK